MKKITFNRKLTFALVCAVIAVGAVATYALTAVNLAEGAMSFSQLFNGPADVAMRDATMQPGDATAWHYHPGKAYVIVKSGTVTEATGCGGTEIHTAGQAFEEPIPRVHQLRNNETVPAEFLFTVIVPSGQPRTITVPGPLCGPPTNMDQCKDNGWLNFNFPRSFEDQGDCVSFVETGK